MDNATTPESREKIQTSLANQREPHICAAALSALMPYGTPHATTGENEELLIF